MTKRITMSISFVLAICILVACFSVSAFATEHNSGTTTDPFEQIVESKNIEYSNNYVSSVNETETDIAILDVYNLIYDLVYDEGDDTFALAYGGAYVNDDNVLVVNYVGDVKDILSIIGDAIIDYEEYVIFDNVEHSYASLYEVKHQLDEMMANEFDKEESENALLRSIIQYYIDEQTNSLRVTMKQSEQTSSTRSISGQGTVESIFDKSLMDLVICEYSNAELELYTDESVYAGQAIYTFGLNEEGQTITLRSSIGSRGQYIGLDGNPYFGFLTTAHSFPLNSLVFIEHNSTLYRIGELKWGVLDTNRGVDAAFVALDDGYEMTNTVYFSVYCPTTGNPAHIRYSSPSSNGNEIYFRNYYTYMPSGYAIYSNGSTTGRTSGTVVAFDTTINIDGELFYNFCSVTNPFTHGDSGGIMYSNATTGGTYDSYITVGMVEGGSEDHNIAFISTYHRLKTVIDNNPTTVGDITFLTLY